MPLYTPTEAARAVGLNPSTLSTWLKGYVQKPSGRRPTTGAPIVATVGTDLPLGTPSIPFVGLAEALVLAAPRRRRHGPTLPAKHAGDHRRLPGSPHWDLGSKEGWTPTHEYCVRFHGSAGGSRLMRCTTSPRYRPRCREIGARCRVRARSAIAGPAKERTGTSQPDPLRPTCRPERR